MRIRISIWLTWLCLSCLSAFGQNSPAHFLLLTNMTSYILPNPNTLTYGQLDGFTTRNDGNGGWFFAITNAAPIAADGSSVFRITNSASQSGNWFRLDQKNTGTNGPVGPAGGDLSGTYPNPTLTNIITAGGPIGSATVAPIITYDAKGRLTAVSSATITPAAASITGAATLTAGTGLSGTQTGALLTSATLNLANTTVTPGTYGSATQVGQFYVDQQGRLTNAANVTITGTAPGGAAGGALTGTYPNPGVDLSTTTLITGDLPLTNIQQIATARLLGRNTAGTGDIEVITDIPTAITIGGAYVYRVGGTDVAVTDGGTGISGGTSGGIIGFTGTTTIASSVALTASALVLGGGAGATPTPMGSLGTTTTVLHGNASGAPTFGAIVNADITAGTIDLTTKVTGILPVPNGGSGAASFTTNGVLFGKDVTAFGVTAQGGANTVLVANSGPPSFSAAITVGTSVTTPLAIATTSVSTPSIITASGPLTVTPAAGSGLTLNLSTTGDLNVNSGQLVLDTSTGKLGLNAGATPPADLSIGSGSESRNIAHGGTAGRLIIDGDSGGAGAMMIFYGSTHATDASKVRAGALSYDFQNLTGSSTLFVDAIADTVGINTTSGTAALTVNGTAAISGTSTLTGIANNVAGFTFNGVATAATYARGDGSVYGPSALLAADLSGTVSTNHGGTGITTYDKGDLLVGNTIGGLSKVTIGSSGQVATVAGGTVTWAAPATSGTVTSVGLALPTAVFDISGSPVTSSGTLTATFDTQAANTVFKGPDSGSAATPTFTALVAADIPNLDAAKITSGTLAVARGGTGLGSGTSGGVLGFTGSTTLASSVALTANALVLGGGAGATPVPMGSLGTTSTVLHGNASGAPTFGSVALASEVSGDLPFSNIAQISDNSILGNFTGGTADIQVLTSITSANLLQIISNETGTGVAVFNTAPAFVTSISTPAIITASGALTVTPAAGSGIALAMSTTGDLTVNTTQLVVDTSTAKVGLSAGATPAFDLTLGTGSDSKVIGHGGTAGRLFLDGDSGQNGGEMVLYGSAHASLSNQVFIAGSAATFRNTSGTAKMFVDIANDKVGILTTTGNATLAVNGGLTVGGASTADPGANNASIVGTLAVGGTSALTGVANLIGGFTFNGGASLGTYARGDGSTYVPSSLLAADLSGTVSTNHGGTGITTYDKGDLLVGNTIGGLSKVAIGASGTVATVAGGTVTWAAPATSGTVTSVGLALPTAVFDISGSPVTSSGTLTATFDTQSANTVFKGPDSGSAATPTFAALVAADIPNLDSAKITSGTFTVGRGGTGAATFTAGLVVSPGGTTALTTVSGTDTRIPFWSSDTLASDGDLTFVTDTLTATKIVGTTSVTTGALTATGTTTLATALSGMAKLTAGVVTATLPGSTSGQTPGTVPKFSSSSPYVVDSLLTESGSTVTMTGTLSATTAVSTPLLNTLSGALAVTPAAGSGITLNMSTTGDLNVNSGQFIIDTSTGKLGISAGSTPPLNLSLGTGSDTMVIGHGGTAGRFFIDGDSGQNGGEILLYGSTHATLPSQAFFTSSKTTFRNTSGTAKMTIDIANDKVGILTATGNATLAVNGSLTVGGASTADPGANNASIVGTVLVGGASTLTGIANMVGGFTFNGGASSRSLAIGNGSIYAPGTLVAADIPSLAATIITSGTLPAARGGTGQPGSPSEGALLLGDNAGGWTTYTLGTAGQVLKVNAGNTTAEWATVSGSGTVTSVALALPTSVFDISGSPVTASGTLTATFDTQSANTAFMGPTSGGAATPAFRAFVSADIPARLNNTRFNHDADASHPTSVYISGTNTSIGGGTSLLRVYGKGIAGADNDVITGIFLQSDAGNGGFSGVKEYPIYVTDGLSHIGARVDVGTGYRIADAATSGNYLRGNGTDFVSAAIQRGDLPFNNVTTQSKKTGDYTVTQTDGTILMDMANTAGVGNTYTITLPAGLLNGTRITVKKMSVSAVNFMALAAGAGASVDPIVASPGWSTAGPCAVLEYETATTTWWVISYYAGS